MRVVCFVCCVKYKQIMQNSTLWLILALLSQGTGKSTLNKFRAKRPEAFDFFYIFFDPHYNVRYWKAVTRHLSFLWSVKVPQAWVNTFGRIYMNKQIKYIILHIGQHWKLCSLIAVWRPDNLGQNYGTFSCQYLGLSMQGWLEYRTTCWKLTGHLTSTLKH